MSDMSRVIIPKSDQLNADDLVGRTMTITVTQVSVRPDAPEQPVSIHFEGDNGRPFKPCKSMSRILVAGWGPDSAQYAGKSMTLYRDPKVKFGGIEVGGIRISHLSHLEREMVTALTVSKARRTPYIVRPLQNAPEPKQEAKGKEIDPDEAVARAEEAARKGKGAFTAWWQGDGKPYRAVLQGIDGQMAKLQKMAEEADTPADSDDPFGLPPVDGETDE